MIILVINLSVHDWVIFKSESKQFTFLLINCWQGCKFRLKFRQICEAKVNKSNSQPNINKVHLNKLDWAIRIRAGGKLFRILYIRNTQTHVRWYCHKIHYNVFNKSECNSSTLFREILVNIERQIELNVWFRWSTFPFNAAYVR